MKTPGVASVIAVPLLVARAQRTMHDPSPEELKKLPNKHRFVTEHLEARHNADGSIRVRVAHPWSELASGNLSVDPASWAATRRIIGEEATAELVAELRQRLSSSGTPLAALLVVDGDRVGTIPE